MGMCAVKGSRVLHEEDDQQQQQQQQQVGDGEMSPRSTVSSGSYGSASSQEEDAEVEATSFVGPLWQRSIPKGRRCKPLSFSGMIVYDESGNQVEVTFEEDGDEEYFSPHPRPWRWRSRVRRPRAVKIEWSHGFALDHTSDDFVEASTDRMGRNFAEAAF